MNEREMDVWVDYFRRSRDRWQQVAYRQERTFVRWIALTTFVMAAAIVLTIISVAGAVS